MSYPIYLTPTESIIFNGVYRMAYEQVKIINDDEFCEFIKSVLEGAKISATDGL